MKKVLVLTYYWPPAGGAGVQRWLKFVKYMKTCGWEPVVYTAENGEMPVTDNSLLLEVPKDTTIIKTPITEPYSIYKKFIGRKKEDRINASFLNEGRKTGFAEKISIWIRGNFFIPDARMWWIKPSVSFLETYLSKNKIDAIISSGPPHSMHMIALGLKKKFKHIKWIADFRDPWTGIDFYDKLMLNPVADRKHKKMELNVLESADVVLSVGKGISNELKGIYSQAGGIHESKFKVIENGYDIEDTLNVKVDKDKKFSIAHVGTLVKDRNPETLWKVISKLTETNKAFKELLEIKLVGKVDVYVLERIDKWGLNEYIRKIDYLPHNQVVAEQQASRILLLPVNRTRNAKSILTGKFFEYMASGTPILAIGPVDGELAQILSETKTGLISDFDDEDQLSSNLMTFFKGWLPERNLNKIVKYSRKALTIELCNLLTATTQEDS